MEDNIQNCVLIFLYNHRKLKIVVFLRPSYLHRERVLFTEATEQRRRVSTRTDKPNTGSSDASGLFDILVQNKFVLYRKTIQLCWGNKTTYLGSGNDREKVS